MIPETEQAPFAGACWAIVLSTSADDNTIIPERLNND